jgi:hypothetical protein
LPSAIVTFAHTPASTRGKEPPMQVPMKIACCGAVGIFPFILSKRPPTLVEIGVELIESREGRLLGAFGDAGMVSL